MDYSMRVPITPLPDAPAPVLAGPAAPPPDGFDPLEGRRIEFTPAGKTALALVSLRKRLAAKSHGRLTPRDRKNLMRHCQHLGFNEVWTDFVLGVQ